MSAAETEGTGWAGRQAGNGGAERARVEGFGGLEDGLRQATPWYLWGPYLSERQWGTVREDYSADGQAWDYLPHERARSQAYRWGEDGLAGFSDVEQRLCLALALWNGRDPILKERLYGLTGNEGNHGEDVKEYWWYLDAVPSHAWNRWRYHYPQRAFPYEDLRAENGRRGRLDPEYELLDTGVFDEDRYWIVEVHYAKADPTDLLMTIEITNAGPEAELLHVLPTVWFRNTWSWEVDAAAPAMAATGPASVAVPHPFLGDLRLEAGPDPDGSDPTLLFCDNETNTRRLYGADGGPDYPKDGINDHVVGGAATVNPERKGSKCAAWYRLTIAPGQTAQLRLRLSPADAEAAPGPADAVTALGSAGAEALDSAGTAEALGSDFDRVLATRRAEADEFYAGLTPAAASADEALVMRQAFAGMLWSKQLYYYDVTHWLEGDPSQPPPPASRRWGRNSRWRSFNSFDIMSMPDKWEYPWFAAWDLAFHCVALAHVDPGFAKYQLILLCREWFQNPNGGLPAYEWDFGDVNPPVQAWAALEVFGIDGGWDVDFLGRVFVKLLLNFTWWVNRQDADGSNLFEGGFLGLDNIGPLDRSHLPAGSTLEQADATGWMGFYALAMGVIATILRHSGYPHADDLVQKFLEHFAAIRDAIDAQGMWDETDGLFYDRLTLSSGATVPVKVRSMVGIIPMLAAGVVDESVLERAQNVGKHFAEFLDRRGLRDPEELIRLGHLRGTPGNRQMLLGVVGIERVERLFTKLFDTAEFLSPHGLRAISNYHREHPYLLEAPSIRAEIGYEPAESTTDMFGGNSNWRGPVWFPLNYLVVSALDRYYRFLGDDYKVEYPTGSGVQMSLGEITRDLWERLVSTFLTGPDGRRPCFGGVERMQRDPAWRDNLLFHEYFNGDDGAGLGASHQTGWTGLVADIIRRRHGEVSSIGDLLRRLREEASVQ
jgi:hypothetical protein